jgi:class 3 adenylate cyclase
LKEQRRLAAIVSADVAGYSKLMGRDESGTLAALKALRQEVVDPAIAGHGGRIVKTTGDGLLLEFPSVVNAVRCAVEVQKAMADPSTRFSLKPRIESSGSADDILRLRKDGRSGARGPRGRAEDADTAAPCRS